MAEKILDGRKKIESRWYSSKHKPWDCVKKGETIYFKNSGEPARIKSEVSKVIQFADLTPKKVREILDEYGGDIGLERSEIPEFFKRFKNKKYCVLVFLKNPKEVKPFDIDKKGFGAMSAWITAERLNPPSLKLRKDTAGLSRSWRIYNKENPSIHPR